MTLDRESNQVKTPASAKAPLPEELAALQQAVEGLEAARRNFIDHFTIAVERYSDVDVGKVVGITEEAVRVRRVRLGLDRDRRRHVWVEFDGRRMILRDWAAELGITGTSLKWRLKHWPIERALTEARVLTDGESVAFGESVSA